MEKWFFTKNCCSPKHLNIMFIVKFIIFYDIIRDAMHFAISFKN